MVGSWSKVTSNKTRNYERHSIVSFDSRSRYMNGHQSSSNGSRSSSASSSRTGTSANFHAIQSWQTVKSSLIKSFGLKKTNADNIEQTAGSITQTPLTLSHGFQSVRIMEHAQADIKSVIYVPNSSMFAALDKENLHLWKSGIKIQKLSISSGAIPKKGENNRKPIDGLWNVSKWLYIDKCHVYVVANRQLELKVLDLNFSTVFTLSNPKPTLCLEYSPDLEIVICGEIGGIRIFKMVKSKSYHVDIYVLQEHKLIEEGLEEEWVTSLFFDQSKNRIFAACGTNLYVFNLETAKRIDTYYDIHELSITCINYYEPSEYLITAAKDGTIKIWNARKSLLYDFHDHYNSITGLILMEKACEAERGTIPLLISSSLDGTIRTWNFESGQILSRVDTHEACLGISQVKKNHFFHYTNSKIQIWNVNRYEHTFVMLRSRPKSMKRVEHPNKPARIIATVMDGSVRLISPLSGDIIGTGFPIDQDMVVSQIAYDMDKEMIYALNTNGSIINYDSSQNPFQTVRVWDNSSKFKTNET